MRKIKHIVFFIFVAFLLPAGLFAGWWILEERPSSWGAADWSATGLLPPASVSEEAAIYVLAARTGGMKGALSLHTWIVLKPEGSAYERYEKVGWGTPVRRNAYAADGRWYSNMPYVVKALHGAEAARLIHAVRAAIDSYPYSHRGDYVIWPGPNSNSFVAHVASQVPELGVSIPPNAIGRDYRRGLVVFEHDADWTDYRLFLGGYAGLALGRDTGLELNLLGLVAGFDLLRPAIKLPGFGRIDLWDTASAQSSRGSPATENPPSTTNVWPVMKPASGESR
ncbi:DUF3750 domain-containing protein [Chelativorans salis]|uniref:DUF3750 domain-containing protein n=1 Tax=Chelativorans salis TaxID=2978478 RepID=A0ABT2LGZ0_9HYPH|nr:DUF3750 domain-containing protein [Chelativorans sp. EGI FJ00035]MCT7373479.1 DUF3750 domain-containing protein [Chelativorans sp. EGI FJ00035]